MNTQRKPGGLRALFGGIGAALQWRLLLLWALLLLLPSLIAALPLWSWLSGKFDHTLQADAIAAGFHDIAMSDVLSQLGDVGNLLTVSSIVGIVVALLLGPWLTGMTIASIRAGHRLGFAALLQQGLGEYGRMLRMSIWMLFPVGVAIALGSMAMKMADKHTEQAILQSQVDSAGNIALVVLALLFVLAHASVEAGRGVLGANPALRSVLRAWWRGLKLLLRRPLATLVVYLGTAVLGYGLALGFIALRVQTSAASWLGFAGGLLLTQLIVVALAWGRNARLYGMANLARHEQLHHESRAVSGRKRRWSWRRKADPAAQDATAA